MRSVRVRVRAQGMARRAKRARRARHARIPNARRAGPLPHVNNAPDGFLLPPPGCPEAGAGATFMSLLQSLLSRVKLLRVVEHTI